ncbi:MAG TPA: hypothetical protein VMJ30_07290 [Gemmatimonadales bacterium]|nr:hypothetical protein [Gemmatimonadales bacterium]
MAYSYERPDLRLLGELEHLMRQATEELAAWRRRTLKAEAELQEYKAGAGVTAGPDLMVARQRVVELEVENQALRQRIESARERVQGIAHRLAFLEQERDEGAA